MTDKRGPGGFSLFTGMEVKTSATNNTAAEADCTPNAAHNKFSAAAPPPPPPPLTGTPTGTAQPTVVHRADDSTSTKAARSSGGSSISALGGGSVFSFMNTAPPAHPPKATTNAHGDRQSRVIDDSTPLASIDSAPSAAHSTMLDTSVQNGANKVVQATAAVSASHATTRHTDGGGSRSRTPAFAAQGMGAGSGAASTAVPPSTASSVFAFVSGAIAAVGQLPSNVFSEPTAPFTAPTALEGSTRARHTTNATQPPHQYQMPSTALHSAASSSSRGNNSSTLLADLSSIDFAQPLGANDTDADAADSQNATAKRIKRFRTGRTPGYAVIDFKPADSNAQEAPSSGSTSAQLNPTGCPSADAPNGDHTRTSGPKDIPTTATVRDGPPVTELPQAGRDTTASSPGRSAAVRGSYAPVEGCLDAAGFAQEVQRRATGLVEECQALLKERSLTLDKLQSLAASSLKHSERLAELESVLADLESEQEQCVKNEQFAAADEISIQAVQYKTEMTGLRSDIAALSVKRRDIASKLPQDWLQLCESFAGNAEYISEMRVKSLKAIKEETARDKAFHESENKKLDAEENRLKVMKSSAQQESQFLDEKRKQVEDAILNQTLSFEDERDAADNSILELDREIEELTAKLAAKRANREELISSRASADIRISAVRAKFSKQSERLAESEAAILETETEIEVDSHKLTTHRENMIQREAASKSRVANWREEWQEWHPASYAAVAVCSYAYSRVQEEVWNSHFGIAELDRDLRKAYEDLAPAKAETKRLTTVSEEKQRDLTSLMTQQAVLHSRIPEVRAAKEMAISTKAFKQAADHTQELKNLEVQDKEVISKIAAANTEVLTIREELDGAELKEISFQHTVDKLQQTLDNAEIEQFEARHLWLKEVFRFVEDASSVITGTKSSAMQEPEGCTSSVSTTDSATSAGTMLSMLPTWLANQLAHTDSKFAKDVDKCGHLSVAALRLWRELTDIEASGCQRIQNTLRQQLSLENEKSDGHELLSIVQGAAGNLWKELDSESRNENDVVHAPGSIRILVDKMVCSAKSPTKFCYSESDTDSCECQNKGTVLSNEGDQELELANSELSCFTPDTDGLEECECLESGDSVTAAQSCKVFALDAAEAEIVEFSEEIVEMERRLEAALPD